MTKRQNRESGRPREGPRIEQVVDDVVGVDFKLPRTLRDLLVRPTRVAEAAVAGDRSRYSPPFRLFVFLFGLQLAVFSFFQIFEALAPSAQLPEDVLPVFEAKLATAGHTLAEADSAYVRWYNISAWPAMIASSLIYIVVFKAIRPRLSILGHVLLYIVWFNAISVAALPLMAVLLVRPELIYLYGVAILAVSYGYLWSIIRRFLADTLKGALFKFAVLALMLIPTFVINGIVQFVAVDVAMAYDVGAAPVWTMLAAAIEAAAEESP